VTATELRALRVLLAVGIIAILVALGIGYRNCARRGGTYVRGLVWMECVR
jgi:hypothetical protein